MRLWVTYFVGLALPLVRSSSDTLHFRFKRQTGRIVGGEDASPGEWPWQGAMLFYNSFSCGCSLINNKWAVTAAHCTQRRPVSEYSLQFGVFDRFGNEETRIIRKVADIFDHPDYNDYTLENDISLLSLDAFVPTSTYVQPVRLPNIGDYVGSEVPCWITGWGSIKDGSSNSPAKLQEAMVPTINNNLCSSWYSFRILRTQLCAGYELGGIDTCQGDSGGPLVCQLDSGFVLQGITSFGDGCARPKRPGVYTRVTEYLDWIEQTVGDEGSGFETSTSSHGVTISSHIVTTSSSERTFVTKSIFLTQILIGFLTYCCMIS